MPNVKNAIQAAKETAENQARPRSARFNGKKIVSRAKLDRAGRGGILGISLHNAACGITSSEQFYENKEKIINGVAAAYVEGYDTICVLIGYAKNTPSNKPEHTDEWFITNKNNELIQEGEDLTNPLYIISEVERELNIKIAPKIKITVEHCDSYQTANSASVKDNAEKIKQAHMGLLKDDAAGYNSRTERNGERAMFSTTEEEQLDFSINTYIPYEFAVIVLLAKDYIRASDNKGKPFDFIYPGTAYGVFHPLTETLGIKGRLSWASYKSAEILPPPIKEQGRIIEQHATLVKAEHEKDLAVIELAQLKGQLDAEKGRTSCLTDKLVALKKSYTNEISLLRTELDKFREAEATSSNSSNSSHSSEDILQQTGEYRQAATSSINSSRTSSPTTLDAHRANANVTTSKKGGRKASLFQDSPQGSPPKVEATDVMIRKQPSM